MVDAVEFFVACNYGERVVSAANDENKQQQ